MPDEQVNGLKLTGTAAALGEINVRGYNEAVINLTMSASTETVNFTGTTDGLNYGAAKLRPIDMSTGAVYASSDLKTGMFRLNVKGLCKIKATKSATTETATLRTGLGQ